MISFKQWQLLHENIGTNFALGVKAPHSIGVDEAPMLYGMMRKAKKMHGGEDMGGDDMGGDDMGGPPMMKKKKPPMGDMGGGEDMGGDDAGDDDDMGSADDTDIDEPSGETGDEGDGDMGGDASPDMGGDMGGGDDMGGEEGGPPMKGPMKKKPMPPPSPMMKKMGYMKKEHGQDGVEDASKDTEVKYKTGKDKSVCTHSKKCNCKMAKEENEFLDSIKRQCGASKFAPDEFGYWGPVQEDALISPDANSEETNEPGPGEVGYAPTQKVGNVGSFSEWSSKKTKK